MLRIRPMRLLLGTLVAVGVTALLLAVPVVSGKTAGSSTAGLTTPVSAGRGPEGSPVVMGEDGAPLPAPAVVPGGTGSRSAGRSATAPTGGARSRAVTTAPSPRPAASPTAVAAASPAPPSTGSAVAAASPAPPASSSADGSSAAAASSATTDVLPVIPPVLDSVPGDPSLTPGVPNSPAP
jgi:hypothetical protein